MTVINYSNSIFNIQKYHHFIIIIYVEHYNYYNIKTLYRYMYCMICEIVY